MTTNPSPLPSNHLLAMLSSTEWELLEPDLEWEELRAGALRAAAALPRWQDTGRRIANLIANLTGTTSIK